MSLGRVLVTGAAGFVGANAVRRLLADGDDVVAAVRRDSDTWRLDSLAGVPVEHVRIDDRDDVLGLVSRVHPDVVLHLAAHGGYSWQTDRARIAAVDYGGFVNVAEACERGNVRALVNAGSSSEYGRKASPPGEDDPLEPASDYAVAKAAASLYGQYAGRDRGTPIVTVRIYSAYGPWEDPRRLVPTLVSHALVGRLPVLVEPRVARDFVHVSDVVDGLLAAAARPIPGRIYNLGSGRQTTIREIVDTARRLFGVDDEPPWGTMPNRAWDTEAWQANTRLLRTELGWEPAWSLEAGLRDVAQFLQEVAPNGRYLAG